MSVLDHFVKVLNTKIIKLEPKGIFYALEYASGTRNLTKKKIDKKIEDFCKFGREDITMTRTIIQSGTYDEGSNERLSKQLLKFEKDIDRLEKDKNDPNVSIPLTLFALFEEKHILVVNPNEPNRFYIITPYTLENENITESNIIILLNASTNRVVSFDPTIPESEYRVLDKPEIPDKLFKILNDYKKDTEKKERLNYSKKDREKIFFLQGKPELISYKLSELMDKVLGNSDPQKGLNNQRTWENLTANGKYSFSNQQRSITSRSRRYSRLPVPPRSNSIEVDPRNVEIVYNSKNRARSKSRSNNEFIRPSKGKKPINSIKYTSKYKSKTVIRPSSI